MGGHGALSTRFEDDRATSTTPDESQHASQSPTRPPKRPLNTNERTNTAIRHSPTTFSLRSEDEIDQSPTPSPPCNTIEYSSYGVRSIESNIAEIDTKTSPPGSELHHPRFTNIISDRQQDTIYRASPPSSASPPDISKPSSPQSLRLSPLLPLTRESSAGALSALLTPYHLRSPHRTNSSDPSNTPRSASLRSLRLSDDDAGAESETPAVESNDGKDHTEEQDLNLQAQSMPTPELVMPSMSIPRRRPFTESGRRMGKMTIAVIGRPASGKKSLLRAIVQSCEDIVHVDAPNSKGAFSHTAASTRPYPSWWSDTEASRPPLHRRRSGSLNEAILERNIGFVVASTTSGRESSPVRAIVDHLEERFARNFDIALLNDGEILSLLSGNGGSQVDLVLYVLPTTPVGTDIQAIADLSKLATVVPVLGQADTLSEDEIRLLITSIQQAIQSNGIGLPNLSTETDHNSELPIVWPISSATYTDDDNMDASLLMNSCYIQPLAPSSLQDLVRTIFNPDTAARLRHLSARKFLAWRRNHLQSSPTSPGAAGHDSTTAPPSSVLSSPSASQVLVSRPSVATGTSAYTLTRWATDLQRSLRNERDRYQRVPSEDRRGWLIERWRCGGSPVRSARERDVDIEKAEAITNEQAEVLLAHRHTAPLNHCVGPLQDPLGLLACDDMIRRNGTIIVRILGGGGILGAIVLWAMKTWGCGGDDGEVGYLGGR